MADVRFENVTKVFSNGVVAVHDLDLYVADGELLVVLGPSGCGKTTTLRMLAGLERITEGTVSIGGRVMNDVSAKDRDIAKVFQSYALYPHLSVADNLGYPLKLAKMDKPERNERVLTVARQLQLDDLLDRKPRQLSGGQRQRVAMGRAMVRKPSVFLMDEPLSNLDAKLRVQMRSEVAELQRTLGATMVYVTHDQVEAMTMGDRVALMHRGELMQLATPGDLYERPDNLFAAGFIGSPPMNLFSATVSSGVAGRLEVHSGGATFLLDASPSLTAITGRPVVLGVRPEHLTLDADGDLSGTVQTTEMLGSESLVHIDIDELQLFDGAAVAAPHRIVVKLHGAIELPTPGSTVTLSLESRHLHVFDPETGLALRGEK